MSHIDRRTVLKSAGAASALAFWPAGCATLDPAGTALSPLPVRSTAPRIVRLMGEAGRLASVGPMAAVAGAVAQVVGEGLAAETGELLVENGGDLYVAGEKERVVAIFTGEGGLGSRLGLRIGAGVPRPLGICTSSGRFGHSLSLGEASTATILASAGGAP